MRRTVVTGDFSVGTIRATSIIVALVALLGGLGGCGGSSSSSADTGSSTGPADTADSASPTTLDVRDALVPDIGALDVSAEDTTPLYRQDVEKGDFGSPCLENDDCKSGWCVGWDEGYVCTDLCIGSTGCPEGWDCKQILNTGVDGVFACFPSESHLCQPCASDFECSNGYCQNLGEEQRCTRSCSAQRPCPGAYDCVETTSEETGKTTYQCVPKSGLCDCGPVNAGVVRSCAKRNEFGTCWGQETCDPERGWIECSAQTPATEDCNGNDDDCDNIADEDLELPSEPCEHEVEGIGKCVGAWNCAGPQGWLCSAGFPTEEVCDYQDNDCDGQTDEGFRDLNGEYATLHDCGACNRDCENTLPHAVEKCAVGENGPACVVDACDDGYLQTDDLSCLPLQSPLCMPCVSDATCVVPGDACIPTANGSYCGRNCGPDSKYGEECPEGYVCGQPFPNAPDVLQCMPASGSCDCTTATAGLERSCRNENEFGACFGVQGCDPSVGWSDCTAKEPVQEICNALDDDCDGLADEGALEPTTPCQTTFEDGGATAICRGNWVCTGTGPTQGFECLAPIAAPETCDYKDNDCDGETDEEFKLAGTNKYAALEHCGACGNSCVGAIPNATARCDASGPVATCVVDACAPGYYAVAASYCLPAEDSSCTPCNSDENCPVPGDRCLSIDGAGFCARDCGADNIFGSPEGQCSAGYTCTEDADAPEGKHCRPQTGSCTCRRQADAGSSRSCIRANGSGTCTGLQVCDPAAGWSNCSATEPGPEVCDGVDNDCDARVDESVTAPATPCQQTNASGTCTGAWHCAADTDGQVRWVCDAPAPDPEVCDYLDNNCDGATDEDFRDPSSGLYGTAENCGLCGYDCSGTILFATEVGCAASSAPAHCIAIDCAEGYYRPAGIDNVCVPQNVADCSPCGDDTHCEGLPGKCMDIDPAKFCARDCPNGNECLAGFVCVEGQCLPNSSSCTCMSANDGDVRTCFVTNSYGSCVGSQSCRGGVRWSDCSAEVPSQEVCDGADNDCNGLIDDQLNPPPQVCQKSNAFGTCPGSWVCELAGLDAQWTCNAPTPSTDTCDYKDNDCDGRVDEDFRDAVSGIYNNLQHCGACGVTCVGAIPHATARCIVRGANARCEVDNCEPGYFQVGELTCLPISENLCSPCASDENCQVPGDKCLSLDGGKFCGRDCAAGNLHDLPAGQCPDGYECLAQPDGSRQCLPESRSCTCLPGNEDDTRACVRANTYGTCFGQETCDPAGGWSACSAHEPGVEVCDGIDNDCNNFADDVPGRGSVCEVTNEFGACEGTLDCAAGSTGLACIGQEPAAEVCNFADDDCDGGVDEGFDGLYFICSAGQGACQRYGFTTCAPDGASVVCNAQAGTPQPERCNGVDDNCDGRIDETWDTLNTVCTVGTGACARGGIYVCRPDGTGVQCNATPGAPQTERCNGLDDDCNGTVDPPNAQGCLTFYTDVDKDTYGVNGTGSCLCLPDTTHTALVANDCDDTRFTVNPSSVEVCNGLDDDCDRSTDEGVLSECGNCDTYCSISNIGGTGDEPFTPTVDNASGVWTNPAGSLIIDTSKINLSFIWIANSAENTVTQLNTITGTEVGRYRVCANPSRTAVDLLGNMYVGCRDDDGVAKVILDRNLCTDKNRNGVIDTSQDLNGDRSITGTEILPLGQDECVAWIVYPFGRDINAVARAVAIDRNNNPWIGYWSSIPGKGYMVHRLNPETGAVAQEIGNLPAGLYGLVIDRRGRLWGAGRLGNRLVRIDIEQNPPTVTGYTPPGSCTAPYGIVVDQYDRIWMANSQCDYIFRFDPNTNQWTTVAGLSQYGYTRGIAANRDGQVVVAHHSWTCLAGRSVTRIDAATARVLGNMAFGSGVMGTVGVAYDYQGYLWAINQCTSNATKLNPTTGQVILTQPVGTQPYTYSDMTGYNLHVFTAPNGYYRHTVAGWPQFGTDWVSLTVNASVPANTYMDLRIRSAATVSTLRSAQWTSFLGPFPPRTWPLDLHTVPNLTGDYLEIELWMFSRDYTATPTVSGIDVRYTADPH